MKDFMSVFANYLIITKFITHVSLENGGLLGRPTLLNFLFLFLTTAARRGRAMPRHSKVYHRFGDWSYAEVVKFP